MERSLQTGWGIFKHYFHLGFLLHQELPCSSKESENEDALAPPRRTIPQFVYVTPPVAVTQLWIRGAVVGIWDFAAQVRHVVQKTFTVHRPVSLIKSSPRDQVFVDEQC